MHAMFSFYQFILVDCETSNFAYVNHTQIYSWNQPVPSIEVKVLCSRNQREPLMGLVLASQVHFSLHSKTAATFNLD